MPQPDVRITSAAAAARAAFENTASPLTPRSASGSSSFESVLAANELRLSTHAEKRLAARDIRLDAPDAQRLAEAVNRAQQKGSRESLILMDDLAFIVDVQRRTVVTAINSYGQKEGVFTKIDSVVLAK